MNYKSLVLILLSFFIFNSIHAEITWNLSDDGTLTISGTSMPNYGVFNSPWYSQKNKIKKVIVENGVTNIGDGAFGYCANLSAITIPNSVTSIGDATFGACTSLSLINIPESVTSIGAGAFCYCNGLTSVTIPDGVTRVEAETFKACSALTSIYIPDGVTSIGKYAFESCSSLTSINIPDGVTSYEAGTFSGCSSLTSIKIPVGTTSIEDYTFSGCSALTQIVIPNSVTSIGRSAFSDSGLTSVTIPNSVTSIGEDAFAFCPNITSITIPNSVTSIGNLAFRECSSLTSITIGSSVTSIECRICFRCDNLSSIIIDKDNTVYDSRNNCNAIIETKTNTLKEGCKNTVIPNSVTSIGQSAFYQCYQLESITIPNSVTSIGQSAFWNCNALTTLFISNSVTSIGQGAFHDCYRLHSITCEANTPPNCDVSCFGRVGKSIPVYVPANSIDAYKGADQWKDFTNIQAIPGTYTLLTDGDSYTINSQCEGCDISYTRTFNNDKWQALYIPFSMSYDDWKDDFDVAYINGVRQLDTNDDNVIDETIMDVYRIESGSLIPNTPYLIRAKTTGEKTISVSSATLYPAEENSIDCSTTIAKYTFTGNYSTIPAATLIENEYYAMGGGAIIMTDGESDLKPFRWYMKIEARSPIYNFANAAKIITIKVMGEERETTGVRQLQITNDELPVYDLNGRKVNENSLKPGLYIKNGKKVVIK